jgi:hypothetical protein
MLWLMQQHRPAPSIRDIGGARKLVSIGGSLPSSFRASSTQAIPKHAVQHPRKPGGSSSQHVHDKLERWLSANPRAASTLRLNAVQLRIIWP